MARNNQSDKVRLCSEALAKINGPTISSFEENSRSATMCAISYDRIYLKCLAMSKWSFTRTFKTIAKDASYKYNPETDMWSARFMLPDDCINVLGVLIPPQEMDPISMTYSVATFQQFGRLDSYSSNYQLREGFIYTNASSIILDYQYRVDESNLYNYPLFREYLVTALAAELAMSVMNDKGQADRQEAYAQEALSTAMSTDRADSPTPFINYSTTIARMRSFG